MFLPQSKRIRFALIQNIVQNHTEWSHRLQFLVFRPKNVRTLQDVISFTSLLLVMCSFLCRHFLEKTKEYFTYISRQKTWVMVGPLRTKTKFLRRLLRQNPKVPDLTKISSQVSEMEHTTDTTSPLSLFYDICAACTYNTVYPRKECISITRNSLFVLK